MTFKKSFKTSFAVIKWPVLLDIILYMKCLNSQGPQKTFEVFFDCLIDAIIIALGIVLAILAVQSISNNFEQNNYFSYSFIKPARAECVKDEASATSTAAKLLLLTNLERQKAGLNILCLNTKLSEAAQNKAMSMALNGYFSHTGPQGQSFDFWITATGYKYTRAGENLAVNFKNIEDAHTAWMKSPSHKKNVLNPDFTELGFGSEKGLYKGQNAPFFSVVFATPATLQELSTGQKITK
jgi:uncharacterized protein YkwD